MIISKARTNTIRASRAKRRGIAAVEFALVVPFFILLVFGIIEIGRAIMVNQILTNAAREGARQAILEGSSASEVETLVAAYLAGSSISGSNVTISPTPDTAQWRDPITVSVSVPINNVAWMATSTFFPASAVFNASSTMLKDGE